MNDQEKDLKQELPEEEQVDETIEEVEQEIEETETEADPILELQAKVDELEDKNLRLQAEIVNMRQRNQREREDAAKYRSQDLAKALLPAIDNLERALAVEASDDQTDALKKGVEMVLDNLKEALKNHGIEVIEAAGEKFDPNVHQAVQTVPASEEHPSEIIVEELQKGYKLHDRVLRPAMVIVAQ